MMKTIAVFWSNRSEESILRPVIEALEHQGFTVQEYKVPDDPDEAWKFMANLDVALPDCALVPYDRAPMAAVAYVAYHCGVPIAQLHAGDISSGTVDDKDRWCITAWATYHFCAGRDQATRVRKFLKLMGVPKEDWRVCISGITNLDDLDKMTEPPDEDYDVVMYNPPTRGGSLVNDLSHIVHTIDKKTYWVEPNGDQCSGDVWAYVGNIAARTDKLVWTKTMPHEAMLGLLSRAKRVIGNSSALYFEAPYFGCEVVPIGERNRIRENVPLKPGGSGKIARRLETWLLS